MDAGRYFVLAEKQTSDLLCPSYQENLSAAINCYEHAIKVCNVIVTIGWLVKRIFLEANLWVNSGVVVTRFVISNA